MMHDLRALEAACPEFPRSDEFPADLDWDAFDQTQASAEGWDLFWTGGGSHALYELEVIDSPDDFVESELTVRAHDSDCSAADIVAARALAGSALHRKALAFLHREAPDEWRFIYARHVLSIPDDQPVPDYIEAWCLRARQEASAA